MYDAAMRTTVDLPASVHRRARDLASRQHRSLSAVLVDLTIRGLATMDEPVDVSTDPVTRLPVLSVGRVVTAQQVADILADE